ncbi:MAG: 2-C-methyl-D-erythritol 4-phosphate cytidylyltransferase [Candidatus Omnitrophica bacterium]|nr:2-C-methyl-D-erythritol 4-phosphate cytidylyltransferase [Candidatus Omnitrophota bacterium]
MNLSTILLAAGAGKRFKSKVPKPLVSLAGKPVFIYSLQILSKLIFVRDIVVVVNSYNASEVAREIKRYRIKKIRCLVKGGRRRQDSVLCGLNALDQSSDFVLIHDSARPFISSKMVSVAVKEACKTGAAILGVPVKATIKEIVTSLPSAVACEKIVKKTLDRSKLWEIQTPQVFKKDVIVEAYRKFGKKEVTDDASLVEKLGKGVAVVQGAYSNIKITTPEDLQIAGAIAKNL